MSRSAVVHVPLFPALVSRHSQRNSLGELGSEDYDNMARTTVTSPAQHHTNRSSASARNQTECMGTAAQTPHIAKDTSSSRQRPLSAPPKAYPFTRDVEPSRTQTHSQTADSRRATSRIEGTCAGDASRRYSRDTGVFQRDGRNKERGTEGQDRGGAEGRGESRTAQERQSLSSVFGAASDRRLSEENGPIARSAPYPAAKRKSGKSRKDESGLPEDGAEGDAKVNDATAVPPSSQEFGLHRWKEYAVLR